MIFIICRGCKTGLRIGPGEPGESEMLFGQQSDFYPDRYPCFRCEKPVAELVPAIDSQALQAVEIFDVTPREAFAAMNGLGLPDEQECSATAVTKLFESQPVSHVKTRVIRNSHRCIVEYIEFENGVRIYLGSSVLGATVYRVAQPHSYAEQVG